MKRYWILLLVLIVSSCQQKQTSIPSADPLLEVDKRFSEVSAEKGWVEAFLEFGDTNLVLLRPKSPPIEGRMFLMAYLLEYGDTTTQLTWEPQRGFMAASGELGYTYGIWTAMDDSSKVKKGTYVTIWRKNQNGEWKYVLDTGNSGLSDL